LIDDEIAGAGKLMISISGGTDMSLMELDAIVATIADQASPEVELAWGASVSEALDGIVRVALIAQGHRPQMRSQAAPARAASVSVAPICSAISMPEAVTVVPGVPLPAETPADAAPAFAVAATLADASVTRPAPVADIVIPLAATPVLAMPLFVSGPSSRGDLTATLIDAAASEAPLLDLIDRLSPPVEIQCEHARSPDTAAPAALNLKGCTMDELWLGDFEMEDPRRVSLVEQISAALKGLFRSMTLRLGFGRHSMIAYRGGRAPLAT
jgi:cell division protein FtsZ